MHPIAKRLYEVHEFEADVVDSVVAAARDQDVSYKQFLAKYEVSRPFTYKPKGLPAVQVLDLKPRGDYHESAADILHLPMANGLTRNKVFRSVMLHLANPSRRLIVFANPGVPLVHRYGKPRLRQLPKILRGDLKPMVDSSVQYLMAQKITSAAQYGYSFGADRALAMAAVAAHEKIAITKTVIVEPASIKPKRLLQLMRDFNSSGKGLAETLKRADSKLLRSSRPRRSEHPILVGAALLRPTNLAVSRALSRGGFVERLRAALLAQPKMKVHLIWGSNSELAQDDMMQILVDEYDRQGGGRLTHTRLAGRNHSMADDVALHAAIMLQASRDLDKL